MLGRFAGSSARERSRSNGVSVTSVRVDGSRLECSLDARGAVSRFLTGEDLYVEYDVDLSEVPESVLTVPLLAQVCPVAWTVGAEVRVPTVDRRFLDSLRRVGTALCEMYPSFMRGGRVVARDAPTADTDDAATTTTERNHEQSNSGENAGMLFTGGGDSLATYIRHREEDPTLINVRGWLVGADDDRWSDVAARIEAYGERFGAEVQFVRSNMLDVLDSSALSIYFSDDYPGGWYSAVGGGLGLVGLCAPLTAATGLDRLYVAATHWAGVTGPSDYDHWDGPAMPWGSHPAIDNEIAWDGTEVVHDGFELTRQERVEVIADYVADEQPGLQVRACESSPTGDNCNDCEKCFRTALGLAFAGLDPTDHGFALDAPDFARARRHLETGAWLPDQQEHLYWEEFGHLAAERDSLPIDDDRTTLRWLRETDFAALSGKPHRDRALRAVARRLPYPVFDGARTVYDRLIG